MPTSPPPTCPYCGSPAECVGGDVLYPHRGDMGGKFFWRCPKSCDAWIGCMQGTTVPMGRLANVELRTAKRRAHDAFAKLYGNGGSRRKREKARSHAYGSVAHALGIPREQCHIPLFDLPQCRKFTEACERLNQDAT